MKTRVLNIIIVLLFGAVIAAAYYAGRAQGELDAIRNDSPFYQEP